MKSSFINNNKKSAFSLGKTFFLFLLSLLILFSTSTYFFLLSDVKKVIKNIKEDILEDDLHDRVSAIKSYLDIRLSLLNDLAKLPIVVNSVMHPEQNLANVKDFFGTVTFLGEKPFLTLLDFSGQIILSNKMAANSNINSSPEVIALLLGKKESNIGVLTHHSLHKDEFNWVVATSVKYNDLQEGFLIMEIPIDQEIVKWGGGQDKTISIYHNEIEILKLGPPLTNTVSKTISLPGYGISVEFQVDQSVITKVRNEIILKFIALTALSIVVLLIIFQLLGRKLFVLPHIRLTALSKELQKLKNAIEQSGEMVVVTDKKGIIEYVNPAFERITGYKRDEVMGKTPRILKSGAHDDAFYDDMWSTIKSGKQWHGELINKKKSGDTYYEEMTISPVFDNEKVVTNFVAIKRDITERKQAEDEIEQARYHAEKANKAKSEFLANMSHEIRTPMNAIIGMADLLFETELTKEQEKYITTYRNAGENLLSIINDILDVSKIEAGHLELESTGFGIHKVMEHTREIMAFRAKDKNLEILLDIAQDVPQRIIGDPLRLQQVIINLVGNAIKFTEKGEIVVSVKSHKLEGKNAELMFSVKDSGIGIPKERQDAIFENFSQADSSTTRKFGGTGLGLTISKRLVELMGGSIYVDSEAGKGSTFYFTAKFEADTGHKEETDHLSKDSKVHAGVSVSERPLNILLVEDNDDNRNLVIAYLKKSPHHIETAENGEVAVHKFTSGQYDIVLMDVEMPVMDGYTATRNIREWEKKNDAKSTPIVALTAHALKEHKEKSLAAGCDGHLTKPIKKTKLLEAIEKYTRE